MAKRTQEQAKLIVDEVIGLLVKANDFIAIQKHVSQKYSITERQATTYIAKAREQIRENFKPELDSERALALVRYNDLYRKNYVKGDYRECRNVQSALNELIGANAPVKQDLTTKGESLNNGFYALLKKASALSDTKDNDR